MRFWSIICLAAGFSASKPLPGVDDDVVNTVLNIGSSTSSLGVQSFGNALEERSDNVEVTSPATPLLITRQNTCPCTLSENEIRAIKELAVAILGTTNSNANLVAILGTLNANLNVAVLTGTLGGVIVTLINALFTGVGSVQGVQNPAAAQALDVFVATLAKKP